MLISMAAKTPPFVFDYHIAISAFDFDENVLLTICRRMKMKTTVRSEVYLLRVRPGLLTLMSSLFVYPGRDNAVVSVQ